MMMSSYGNIFRVIGPLWGESSGGFHSQRPVTRTFLMFCLICTWTNGWTDNQDAGDLRRHRAHFDVTVITTRHELNVQWTRNKRQHISTTKNDAGGIIATLQERCISRWGKFWCHNAMNKCRITMKSGDCKDGTTNKKENESTTIHGQCFQFVVIRCSATTVFIISRMSLHSQNQ